MFYSFTYFNIKILYNREEKEVEKEYIKAASLRRLEGGF